MILLILSLSSLVLVTTLRLWWKKRKLINDPRWRKRQILSSLYISPKPKPLGTDRE